MVFPTQWSFQFLKPHPLFYFQQHTRFGGLLFFEAIFQLNHLRPIVPFSAPPPKTLLIKKKLSGFLNDYFVFLREEYILQRNVPLIRNDDEGASAYDEGASA